MSHVIYNISITTWCISVYTEHSIIVIHFTGHNCNKNCNKNQVVIEVLWSLTNVVMENVFNQRCVDVIEKCCNANCNCAGCTWRKVMLSLNEIVL